MSRPSPEAGRRSGFVTGLAVETRVLRYNLGQDGAEPLTACAGADAGRARAAAEALVAADAGALVSYGIAGGLDPALAAGTLLLPEAVLTPGGPALATDAAWRTRLLAAASQAGHGFAGGLLAGSDRALAGVAEKRGLHETSAALAVDMESHAVGLAARDAGLPFLVLRAVADPAGRALPRSVIGSIRPDGRPRAGLVAARLALRPWEIAAVGRLRQDARAALSALGRVTRALGPGLVRYDGEGF